MAEANEDIFLCDDTDDMEEFFDCVEMEARTDKYFDCLEPSDDQCQVDVELEYSSDGNAAEATPEQDLPDYTGIASASQDHQIQPPKQVLMVGISHMERCRKDLQEGVIPGTTVQQGTNLMFPDSELRVSWRTRPGGYFKQIAALVRTSVAETQPDVLILEVGSNDLTQHWMDALTLSDMVNDLVDDTIANSKIQAVVVMHVLRREKQGVRQSPQPIADYNARVKMYNNLISGFMDKNDGKIAWHYQRQLSGENAHPFRGDGIHLSDNKMYHYYHDLGSAIRKALKLMAGEVGKTRETSQKVFASCEAFPLRVKIVWRSQKICNIGTCRD